MGWYLLPDEIFAQFNSKQIVHPLLLTEKSERHVKDCPAVTGTRSGPAVPLYETPLILTWSQQASVSNWVAVSVPADIARIVQASLLP